jgi:hypothetical protein
VNDPLAERLLEELRACAGRRRRLLLLECDDALLEAAPHLRSDPSRRRRLLELLTVLRDGGQLAWSAGRDRSIHPPMPSFVTLTTAEAPSNVEVSSAPAVPWRPELEWAHQLRLTPSEQELLGTLNTYLRDRPAHAAAIPHRERALLLFGDEKRLDRLIRTRLFDPGRLSLPLLDAFWAPPPIAWCRVGERGDTVVSENAASFHTLRTALAGKVELIAYGAGGAFAQSIAGLAGLVTGQLLYVGDLDAEGIAIPQRAAAVADRFAVPPPVPYLTLWQLLVDLADVHGQPAAPVPTEVAAELCGWFGGTVGRGVQALLEAGIRVPQEALTGERLHGRTV